MRIAIVIPTTRTPTLVERISRRTKLPRSLVLTRGDYRPVQGMSERYHHFVDAAGPLADILVEQDVRYELCLGEAPETGRSWELPVALAHYVMRGGHEIVTENPELVVWATGAIGSDRAILDDDYHLETKLENSRALLEGFRTSGAEILVLVPRGVDEAAAGRAEETLVEISCLASAIAAVVERAGKEARYTRPESMQAAVHAPRELMPRTVITTRSAGFLAVILVTGGGAYWLWSDVFSSARSVLADQPVVASPLPVAVAVAHVVAPAATVTTPTLRLVEYRAPEGASCIDVLFGGAVAVDREVPADENAFLPSSIQGLCALGFLSEPGTGSFTLMLDESILSAIMSSDRQREFTLEADAPVRLQLVARIPATIAYQITVDAGNGVPTVFRHILEPASKEATAR